MEKIKLRIREEEKNTMIENVPDFHLGQTLECGQCFRFYRQKENEYVVIAFGQLIRIRQDGDMLVFLNCDRQCVEQLWIPYFDLERDYGKIKQYLLKQDKKLQDAVDEKYGVRILNQEFHEMLISFIISQNKQIPQIQKLVETLSEHYGTYLGEICGKKYYAFPDIEALGTITEQDFRSMKMGFRAPYLFEASQRLAKGEISKALLEGLPEEAVRAKLMEIKGVGEKVANCVMLFSLGIRSAFPVDVWMKRIMEELYFDGADTPKNQIQDFSEHLYGKYGGYAQQYLFCYGRGKNQKLHEM